MARVNQFGCFLGMRAVAPTMTGGGSIVNVSSILGLIGGDDAFAYTATKFAVRGMTKAAAVELGKLGIRVNSIHPGAIDTPMSRAGWLGRAGPNPLARLPLGRAGCVDDVARLAIFLASDESDYSTGSEFVVDGGWTTMAGPG